MTHIYYNEIIKRKEMRNMKAYFLKTNGNNLVILTDGDTAKIYDGAPSGIYEGVDLYADDAAEQLKNSFEELEAFGDMNDYSDIWSDNEVDFSEIESEIEDAELVFDSKDQK